MHCYRHPEQHAVAVCQNCGKGACADCCEDTGQGIACCAACAAEIRETYLLRSRQKRSLGVGVKPPLPATVPVYALFGLILLVVGVLLSYSRPGIDYLTLAMAAAFFVMAALSYKRFRDTCFNC